MLKKTDKASDRKRETEKEEDREHTLTSQA